MSAPSPTLATGAVEKVGRKRFEGDSEARVAGSREKMVGAMRVDRERVRTEMWDAALMRMARV